jgi:hypothetical protein
MVTTKRWRPALVAGAAAVLVALSVGAAIGQSLDDFEGDPIRYSASKPVDPVAKLQERLDRGEAALRYEPTHGYLKAILQALKIPVASQTLVFSKTSFQRDRISPQTPRALYFNDHTYIGWVQGGSVVELSTVDPQLGGVFYTLSQEPDARPKFVRQTHECLSCHSSALTKGVPGHIVRSVFTDGAGFPILQAGTFITTDESPWEERWGGWYATGKAGSMRHMGNLIVHSAKQAESPDLSAGANVTDLRRRLDVRPYLSPHSDLAALSVLEHQTYLHNLIARATYETRRALHYEQLLNRELGRAPNFRSESTLSRVKSVAEPLVRALLFSKEAPLAAPIAGSSPFTKEFAAQGPRDPQGRSLRELDLRKRLFRYPCSYLVYSEAFGALPPLAKEYVYRRLWEVLDGRDTSPEFAHLTAPDRAAVLQILEATKPDFAAFKPKA